MNRKFKSYTKPVSKISEIDYNNLIKAALIEDDVENDVTTLSIFKTKDIVNAKIIAKQEGILAGIKIAEKTFLILDRKLKIQIKKDDGSIFKKGECVLEINGSIQSILKAERTALNFLAFLCGISTSTYNITSKLSKHKITAVDTRKTIPGYRKLSKYAVFIGGGCNHRLNLSDMGLIKDNHIAKAKSITQAVINFKQLHPRLKCEVEVENETQLKEALNSNVDIILLDNMNKNQIKKSVQIVKKYNKQNTKNILCEASGGFNENNINTIFKTGVDFVSMGSLTQKINPIDFSLEINN
ncbi:MAG: carboxylating nicotinate-nucleotide diphosphorylase [Spirochaetia bacterium]|nr:carboxylating nicotinate-nucleotide diphosphorylase [Spirochaetia bacterium]